MTIKLYINKKDFLSFLGAIYEDIFGSDILKISNSENAYRIVLYVKNEQHLFNIGSSFGLIKTFEFINNR